MSGEKSQDYSDILYMPHHQSTRHPHMAVSDRAAQFMPFAALTGYEDAVKEVGRRTEARHQLDEDVKETLNRKLSLLLDHIQERPEICVTYFVPDAHKEGGAYVTKEGHVRKRSTIYRQLMMEDETIIRFDDIWQLDFKE